MDSVGLETFLAIVRTRSISRAAEVVHATQGTVSYRLKSLEQEVGERLLERSRGQNELALTTYGSRFLAIAEKWELLQQEMRE